jgi:hypothetical protein
MTELVRRRINKGKSKSLQRPRQPMPAFVLKLLEAMGKIKSVIPKSSCYTRHQGPRECARRVRQMQKTTSTS